MSRQRVKKRLTRTNRKREVYPNFLGQHLLHNKKVISDMLAVAELTKQDLVLELGAGKGALTTALCQQVGKVIAVEIDESFVQVLKQKTAQFRNAKIVVQNILNIRMPHEKFVVVSNIPYSITTPIMKMLLGQPMSSFRKAVMMMEKGAVKRFTSSPIKDPYVIAWKMYFNLRFIKTISKNNFSPPPKVDSAIIKITRKAHPLIPFKEHRKFLAFAAYLLKRPQDPLSVALRGIFKPHQMAHLRRSLKLQLDEVSVEYLTEHEWAMLHAAMVKHVPKNRWPKY